MNIDKLKVDIINGEVIITFPDKGFKSTDSIEAILLFKVLKELQKINVPTNTEKLKELYWCSTLKNYN